MEDNFNFIDNIVNQSKQNYDKAVIEFLRKSGYTIEEPIKAEQLEEIRNDLESKGLFIDAIQDIEYNDDKFTIVQHVYPFFNCIDAPLTEEGKQRMLKEFKERNAKNQD